MFKKIAKALRGTLYEDDEGYLSCGCGNDYFTQNRTDWGPTPRQGTIRCTKCRRGHSATLKDAKRKKR